MFSQRPSEALQSGRDTIHALAKKYKVENPRVFGSVLAGKDTFGSDLDILVDALPTATLFDLGGLQNDLEEALGVRVDVRTPFDLPPHIRADVLRTAEPI